MKKNNEWFSIIVWMWMMILIVLSAYVILWYMIPFMKSVRWIENTSLSYYQAYSWIEQGLYDIKMRTSLLTDVDVTRWNSSSWVVYKSFSSTRVIPQAWYGNSEYNTGYNLISLTDPIQLSIWNRYVVNWSNVQFDFRVPAFSWWTTLTLSGWTLPIIQWILSTPNNTFMANGPWNYISASQINTNNSTNIWNIDTKQGLDLYGNVSNFSTFYSNNCWTSTGCILKISLLNQLELTNGAKIPYLEYKINFGTNTVPDRYTRIESYGKSYGFQKKLDIRIPQETVNQAFDFTVFQ